MSGCVRLAGDSQAVAAGASRFLFPLESGGGANCNYHPITHGASSVNYGSIAAVTTGGGAAGSDGANQVYIHGINSLVGDTHFRNKVELWEILSTGGGSTGGRSYFNDIRLGQSNLGTVHFDVVAQERALIRGLTSASLDSQGPAYIRRNNESYLQTTPSVLQFRKSLVPGADDAHDVGSPAQRVREIYAANNIINTSDARLKEQWQDIPEAWLRAWADVDFGRFKWRDAVAGKGEGARWHIGALAQRIKEVFEGHGIDPFEISLLCYDEWPEHTEEADIKIVGYEDILDGNGRVIGRKEKTEPVYETIPAGSRYGVRYEELLCLEAACSRWRIDKLERAVAQLLERLGN